MQMPFTQTRAVTAISLALLAGASMYSDAMAQGLVANSPYRCFRQGAYGRVACQQYKPTFPFQQQHAYQYQHTFQSPFQQTGTGQCPPGMIRSGRPPGTCVPLP